ncbi:hypothetical protein [uncultured Prevotella sp.]|uniref:hypothetical protein n=1 Tax=uncultured Prevotella sp. TaxID=159272 RepID=UPI0026320D88|nr:hypothetical protein [uncultured Prevotella sp.]
MDERINDKIDRYLRKEMSSEETLLFEQEILNDEELRKEVEVSILIRKSLAGCAEKLRTMNRWRNRKKNRIIKSSFVVSIAAIFVVGFFLFKSIETSTDSHKMVAVQTKSKSKHLETPRNEVNRVKEKVRYAKNDKEVVEAVDELDKCSDIPSFSMDISGNYMSHETTDTEEERNLMLDIYELQWKKITSLLRMGKYKEAVSLLKQFVTIQGKYQEQADSILDELKN